MFKRKLATHHNEALDPRFYFYRDISGKEVDLLFQQGSNLIPIEIKSGKTFSSSYLDGLNYFYRQAPKKAYAGALIYAGDQTQQVGNFHLLTAENCSESIKV